jgi:LysM repeat protein/ABC-type branched-subunit amino acid transport system substrate-binding protein
MSNEQLTMKKIFVFLLIFQFSNLLIFKSFAQEKGVVITNKSDKVETINGKKYYIHTVLKGQTLYSIAKSYSVSVDDIVKENPDVKKTPIYPDLKLRIPAKKNTDANTSNQQINKPVIQKKDSLINHTVKSKETIYSLTKKYNVTEEEIRNANPSLNLNMQPGQIIKIPYKTDTVKEKKKTSFLKDLFGKSKKKTEKKDTLKKEKPKIDTTAKIINKPESEPPSLDKVKGDVINAALILPLNLNEVADIVTEDIDGELKPPSSYKSLTYLQYYEGAKIALDSLEKRGLNAKLFVYDINNDSSLTDKIIKKPEFENLNIIFCPQISPSYSGFIKYVKKNNIKFVTYSQSNICNLKDYSFSFRLTPSVNEQLKQLSIFIVKKYSNDNILIVYQGNNSVQKKFADFLRKELTSNKVIKTHDSLLFAEVDYSKTGLSGVKEKLNLSNNNILISFINDEVSLSEYIMHLNEMDDTYKITLFGLQSWANFQNVEKDYLQSLNLHLYSPNFVDYSENKVKVFLSRFRNEFKTEPGLYAYQGFDAVYYFLYALMHSGRNFDKYIQDYKADLLENNFHFMKTESGGYENVYLNIYKYQDFKLVNARKE